MKDFILRHKKVFTVLLVILVILGLYFLKPKLSELSDTGLRVYFWLNGDPIPEEQQAVDQRRRSVAIMEEDPYYGSVVSSVDIYQGWMELAAIVNRYYWLDTIARDVGLAFNYFLWEIGALKAP